MKILLLNGNSDERDETFKEQILKLSEILQKKNNQVSLKKLREMKINHFFWVDVA